VFVRPTRSAMIRTRLDREEIDRRLSELAERHAPVGLARLLTGDYTTDGAVGSGGFTLTYVFNARRNRQPYTVHGSVNETPDWRLIRLKLTAQTPWMTAWSIAVLGAYLGYLVYADGLGVEPAVWILFFVLLLFAMVNLLYVPAAVTRRVADLIAGQLSGSVLRGRAWVVPKR
jgi:hypothetical protein